MGGWVWVWWWWWGGGVEAERTGTGRQGQFSLVVAVVGRRRWAGGQAGSSSLACLVGDVGVAACWHAPALPGWHSHAGLERNLLHVAGHSQAAAGGGWGETNTDLRALAGTRAWPQAGRQAGRRAGCRQSDSSSRHFPAAVCPAGADLALGGLADLVLSGGLAHLALMSSFILSAELKVEEEN